MITMIHRNIFGQLDVGDYRETIYVYTLDNEFMTVDVLTYGATISSIKLPDKSGKMTDVVLGFSNLKGYQEDYNPYFGATVGRVCNRIANGCFTVGKKIYYVSVNSPPNTYHGGFHGLDKKIWNVDVDDNKLMFSCISYHLEEGFPGNVEFKAIYELTTDNELKLEMRAKTTYPTPINLTNSSYFNMAGHDTGWAGIRDHEVSINADRYTPVDEYQIPTGQRLPVKRTMYDLKKKKKLGFIMSKSTTSGFGVNYCVEGTKMRFVARAFHRKSGRLLEVYSDQPGVQFCTGEHLSNIPGKNKAIYNKNGGLSFQTQNYPNAVNIESFPNSILEPNDEYSHNTTYKFLFDPPIQFAGT